jgi:hypothetical protein
MSIGYDFELDIFKIYYMERMPANYDPSMRPANGYGFSYKRKTGEEFEAKKYETPVELP